MYTFCCHMQLEYKRLRINFLLIWNKSTLYLNYFLQANCCSIVLNLCYLMNIKMNCTLIIFVSSISLQNVDLFVGSAQDQEHRQTGTSSSSRRSSQRRVASLCASRMWCPTRLHVSFVLRVCASGTRRWRLLCSSSSKRSNRYLTVYHKGQLEGTTLRLDISQNLEKACVQ